MYISFFHFVLTWFRILFTTIICPVQNAEVAGELVPEPFDVRTEEALDASMSVDEKSNVDRTPLTSSPIRQKSSQPFNPFCNIDQVQLSIHCHVNSVQGLVCVPGMSSNDLGKHNIMVISARNNVQQFAIFHKFCLLVWTKLHLTGQIV